ncbi:MAG TPA: carboxypeptidase regulatory-like domain-containing protein, partial [Gemmatimonadales bacterium]|nr:carboxypeptidase regulatory-like domain-containing protein [Gemmatimonadales bacterium]
MLLGLVGVARTLFLLQAVQSSVTGTISGADDSRPLSYAVVALADLDRAVSTDSSGHYRFADVPPGPQHLTIRCLGFAPRVLHVMVPSEGPLQVDVALRPVPLPLPPLDVRAALSLRGLEPGDSTPPPDRGVSLAAVRNDPMLSEPDGLLGLNGGEVAALPESPSGISLRGAPSDQTGYLLDGVPVFSPYHSAGTFSAWNPDALERLQVSSSSPSLDFPEALSGTVSAFTRTPGSALRAQGGMSTSQLRLAVDGPLGTGGAGYLVSYRTGFPALLAPHESSYLGGEISDLILKSQVPVFGGYLHLLWYQGDNSIGGIGSPSPASAGGPIREQFEWGSRSIGAGWVRPVSGGTLRIQSWSARSDAEAVWPAAVPLDLAAGRHDEGVQAEMERSGGSSHTTWGIRLERSH